MRGIRINIWIHSYIKAVRRASHSHTRVQLRYNKDDICFLIFIFPLTPSIVSSRDGQVAASNVVSCCRAGTNARRSSRRTCG